MVRQITPSEFESYPHGRQSAAFIVSDEREWYVDGREVALGIVFRDKVDDDWGYAILGKDPNGKYRWIEGEHSIQRIEDARANLLIKMREIEASSQTVWKQDPD